MRPSRQRHLLAATELRGRAEPSRPTQWQEVDPGTAAPGRVRLPLRITQPDRQKPCLDWGQAGVFQGRQASGAERSTHRHVLERAENATSDPKDARSSKKNGSADHSKKFVSDEFPFPPPRVNDSL